MSERLGVLVFVGGITRPGRDCPAQFRNSIERYMKASTAPITKRPLELSEDDTMTASPV